MQGGSPEGVVRSNDLFAPIAVRQAIRALLNAVIFIFQYSIAK